MPQEQPRQDRKGKPTPKEPDNAAENAETAGKDPETKGTTKSAPKTCGTSNMASQKRGKKHPPSPVKSPPISTERLLEDICALKPYVGETNKRIQSLDDKWSATENRVTLMEKRVDSIQIIKQLTTLLQTEVCHLKKQVLDL